MREGKRARPRTPYQASRACRGQPSDPLEKAHMHICIYIYIYYLFIYLYVFITCISLSLSLYTYIYIYIYIHRSTGRYIYIYIYIYIYRLCGSKLPESGRARRTRRHMPLSSYALAHFKQHMATCREFVALL